MQVHSSETSQKVPEDFHQQVIEHPKQERHQGSRVHSSEEVRQAIHRDELRTVSIEAHTDPNQSQSTTNSQED